jgi:hypothetical protein
LLIVVTVVFDPVPGRLREKPDKPAPSAGRLLAKSPADEWSWQHGAKRDVNCSLRDAERDILRVAAAYQILLAKKPTENERHSVCIGYSRLAPPGNVPFTSLPNRRSKGAINTSATNAGVPLKVRKGQKRSCPIGATPLHFKFSVENLE